MTNRYDWVDPMAMAAAIAQQYSDMAFLHSSMQTGYSGRYSYLAWDAAETLECQHFESLRETLDTTKDSPLPMWYGYLGYEMLHDLEDIPTAAAAPVSMPTMRLVRFRQVVRFDHETQQIDSLKPQEALDFPALTPLPKRPSNDLVVSCQSNMSRERYISIVEDTLEQIRSGQFYQANITRKFYGELAENADVFTIYRMLCQASPAPYSAYIAYGNQSILSSSPELFLKLEPNRQITTRPIKGSLPAEKAVDQLRDSHKDRAENLMIVDLMRNDLSRVASPGSVEVAGLYDIDSFATVHHMSSTIQAQLDDKSDITSCITSCFPPGSMTGTPKISAMAWCSEMEGMARGVYSGAIGWFMPEACELSVVIRTLVIDENRYEFQVGGGIVADSVPDAEWQETLVKARGIANALGISGDTLANL